MGSPRCATAGDLYQSLGELCRCHFPIQVLNKHTHKHKHTDTEIQIPVYFMHIVLCARVPCDKCSIAITRLGFVLRADAALRLGQVSAGEPAA